MRDPARSVSVVALFCIAPVVVLLVVTTFLRHQIAAAVARHELEQRGLSCEAVSVNVPLAIPPRTVRLEPMRCTMRKGAMRSLAFKTSVGVNLDGFEPGRIHASDIDIDLRTRPHRDVELNFLGDLMSIGGFDDVIVDLILDSASLPLRDLPRVSCARMNLTRDGAPVATLRHVRIEARTGGTLITARSAEIEGVSDLLGTARFELWVNATHARGAVTSPSGFHAEVKAVRLASPNPEFQFAIGALSASREPQHRPRRPRP